MLLGISAGDKVALNINLSDLKAGETVENS
jgi:hypothetical protein